MNDVLLLDTHIWVWLINGDAIVKSPQFLKTVDEAIQSSKVRVSIISVWEVATLVRKEKIVLPYNCLEWLKKALSESGILVAELTPQIAAESALLSTDLLKDPADRIIVTTARDIGAKLVTKDKEILAYAKTINLPTIAL